MKALSKIKNHNDFGMIHMTSSSSFWHRIKIDFHYFEAALVKSSKSIIYKGKTIKQRKEIKLSYETHSKERKFELKERPYREPAKVNLIDFSLLEYPCI